MRNQIIRANIPHLLKSIYVYQHKLYVSTDAANALYSKCVREGRIALDSESP